MTVTQGTTGNGLEFYNACYCAGTGCGGHLKIKQTFVNWTPAGYQGPAQHTYTRSCDGFHAPGQCQPGPYRQVVEWDGCSDPTQFS